MLKLDDRDIQILKVLSREGRLSKAELAKRVNLTATPCWERLKRLEDAGVIRGYHAEVALKSIAPHVVVFVTIELESHRAKDFRAFERAVQEAETIVGCWALGGGFDYLVQVVTPDIDSYQRLIDDLLDKDLKLARYYTYVVTKPVKTGTPMPFDMLLGKSG